MSSKISRSEYLDYILKDKIYLLDTCIKLFTGTRPKEYFLNLVSILSIDSDDSIILDKSIKYNLINVTNDIRFTINNLLKSRNIIYQTNDNVRFYFILKELKVLSDSKQGNIEKILNSITRKNKISYVTDNSKTLSRMKSFDVTHIHQKIKNIGTFENKIRLRIIHDYIQESKSVLVTSSKHNCLKTLFQLKECVFVDEKFIPYYISVDYFEFEKVTFDRKINSKRYLENPSNDELHINIRFIRNYIDVIEKNLNFIDSELLRRRELEALRELEQLQVPVSNPIKGIDNLE